MENNISFECEVHTWNLWTDRGVNVCENCGEVELADPDDIKEQHRLLGGK